MVDGAGELRNFFDHPANLYPFLLIAILLRFMDNFRFIDAILILTGGGPADATNILPVYLFDVSFQYFKLGRGAAIALTLLVVTIIRMVTSERWNLSAVAGRLSGSWCTH